MTSVELAKFARYPFGRYASDGPYSGEVFRRMVLSPAFAAGNDDIQVSLDGARGLSSSFLEEAFGGLVRDGISSDEIARRLKIVANADPSLITEIFGYITLAAQSRQTRDRVSA